LKATDKVVQKSILVEKSNEDGSPIDCEVSDANHPDARALTSEPVPQTIQSDPDGDKSPRPTISTNALTHFPDVKLPGNQGLNAQGKNGNDGKSVNRVLTDSLVVRKRLFVALGIAAFVLTFLGTKWIADRSQSEKAFRHYVDQAQLAQVDFDMDKQVAAWRAAIAEATRLGDHPKAIGDLYMQLAKCDRTRPKSMKEFGQPKLAADPKVIDNLQRAMALYKKEPYTQLQQIMVCRSMLYELPIGLAPYDMPIQDSETKRLLQTAHHYRKVGNVALAAKTYADIENNSEARYSQSIAVDDPETYLRTIKSSKIEEVVPLASALLRWSSSNTCESRIESAKYYNARIDSAIANAGHRTGDYDFTRALADKMFQQRDYSSACQLYLRCQAIKDSPLVRRQIQRCYASEHPVSAEVAVETARVLAELLDLHKEAYGPNSSEVTSALDLCASGFESIGNFDRAESLRKEILERCNSSKETLVRYGSYRAWFEANPRLYAESSLLKLYTTEGKVKEARDLYFKSRSSSSDLNSLDFEFVDLCSRVNWLRDPMIPQLVALDRESHRSK
jgi:hypothetical protein